MKNIILLGSGNVATHLGIALKNSNYTIVQVFSKSIKNAKLLAKKLDTHFTNDLTKLNCCCKNLENNNQQILLLKI